MKRLDGKTAVITGGSDGIGLAIARAFARNGSDIILVARDEEKLRKVSLEISEFGVSAKTITADLANPENVGDLADQILSLSEEIDILVNNAGIGRFTNFSETDVEEFDLQFNLNVRTPYFLTQKLLQSLAAVQGCIINISSYFAQKMLSGRPSSAYSLTKGAINSWTKALAFELGASGVRVNAIAPGSVNTPIFRDNLSKLSEKGRTNFNELVKRIYPLGRIGTPEDLSGIAVYLASEEARWVTGAIFNIDGGLTVS